MFSVTLFKSLYVLAQQLALGATLSFPKNEFEVQPEQLLSVYERLRKKLFGGEGLFCRGFKCDVRMNVLRLCGRTER